MKILDIARSSGSSIAASQLCQLFIQNFKLTIWTVDPFLLITISAVYPLVWPTYSDNDITFSQLFQLFILISFFTVHPLFLDSLPTLVKDGNNYFNL